MNSIRHLAAALVCLFAFLASASAFAAVKAPDPDFSISIPDGWEYLVRDYTNLTHPTVAHVLDCVDDDPSLLKQVGWKMEGGKVQGAYCISYRKTGMRQAAVLLKYSKGKERDGLAKQFTDTFAGEIQSGYAKRNVKLNEMSADLLEAGKDILLILDSTVSSRVGTFMRSATVILHDDSLVNIGTVYALDAPASVKEALEAMPLSVKWKR